MAASSIPLGYQCQFLDSVPEDLYCKQCSLVARKLTITSCCGESYCNGCIHSIQQANKPCPGCGEENFETCPQPKYQKKTLSLQTYCSLKERGCGWSGRLEQLETHLDPDEGDCEYADVHCPLKCHYKITRKDVTHHIANECVKRDYICPYCSFKAIYEIVSNIHWPECSYYPLPCPNRCGVTCERPTMEDHMKICPLEKVECEFKHVGCAAKFKREDEEEHTKEKSQTHLTMMATASLKMEQEFQKKLLEQENKLQEQEKKLEEQDEQGKTFGDQEKKFQDKILLVQQNFEGMLKKLEEQEKKLEKQEKRLEEQDDMLQEQGKTFGDQEKKFQDEILVIQQNFEGMLWEKEEHFEMKLREKEEQLQKEISGNKMKIETLERACGLHHSFTMENFSAEKAKNKWGDWKSPGMYTHLYGYKFCIGIDANGCSGAQGNSLSSWLYSMKGEYDDQLNWPVKVRFTLELINHYPNRDNKRETITITWKKPEKGHTGIQHFSTPHPNTSFSFIRHSELPYNAATRTHYLKDDTLHFKVTDIKLLLDL